MDLSLRHPLLQSLRFLSRLLLAIVLWLPLTAMAGSSGSTPIAWQGWSPAAFSTAKTEKKLVILDLEAVWCHWCHVMDQQTYGDAGIAAYLGQHFIAVKVDQDSRPDLANRYRDFGWPATIIFTADGRELAKRAGYIAPADMQLLLQKLVKHPQPLAAEKAPAYASSALLSRDTRRTLEAMHRNSYDSQRAGLRLEQKYLESDSVEYAMVLAAGGNRDEEKRARQTLDAALSLSDPVWGGFYQYSTNSDWQHPHFEKIMAVQAESLRLYALAYAQWHDPLYLKAAQDVRRYLQTFLQAPEGAFYTSQDADLKPGQHSAGYFALGDAARRAQGIPRVDQHLYACENGWAIEALATLHGVTGDARTLADARRAAQWVLAHRALPGGGFRHDEKDSAGPYLGDTLAMGRACLALYAVSSERPWLECASRAGSFIDGHFRQPGAGYFSAAPSVASTSAPGVLRPAVLLAENISATRFFNLLAHYTADARFRTMAEQGMRYVATPAVATATLEEAGVLLAADELGTAPLHLTVVGERRDAQGEALFRLALVQPGWYKRVEYWERRLGPLPDPEVSYPVMAGSAGYVCGQGRCSLPAQDVAGYGKLIRTLSAPLAQ